MHYIHLPLVKTAYQTFLCESPFHKIFLFLCRDNNLINRGSWDENKTGILLLGKRGATWKCLMIQADECGAFSFEKAFVFLCLVRWHRCQQNIDVWLEKCKERRNYNYWVKLLKDWAHHHTGIVFFLWNLYLNDGLFLFLSPCASDLYIIISYIYILLCNLHIHIIYIYVLYKVYLFCWSSWTISSPWCVISV